MHSLNFYMLILILFMVFHYSVSKECSIETEMYRNLYFTMSNKRRLFKVKT